MVSIKTINFRFYYLYHINITFSEKVLVKNIILRNVIINEVHPRLIIIF